MKVMLDTNIIIDVMLGREGFVENSEKILRLCESHNIEGYISASSITDIFYIVRKYTHSNEVAYNAIGKILEIVKICSVTDENVRSAYKMGAKDFEDALISVCAASCGCEYVVTRNGKDFSNLTVPTIEPKDLASRFK